MPPATLRARSAISTQGVGREGLWGFATSDGTDRPLLSVSPRLDREGIIPGFLPPWQDKRAPDPGVAPATVARTAPIVRTAGGPAHCRPLPATARGASAGLGATSRPRPGPVDGTSRRGAPSGRGAD